MSELNITELVNQKVLEFGNERFLEGWNGQQERIIKLINDIAAPYGEDAQISVAFLIALIKEDPK
jgi:hypothetical protein